jgi:hypothetical protein
VTEIMPTQSSHILTVDGYRPQLAEQLV